MRRSVSINLDGGVGIVDELSIMVYADISAERLRAHTIHDTNGRSMERAVYNDPRWLPVLTEELGEVARVLCDGTKGGQSILNVDTAHLREELIQLAAMACAWVVAIDDHPRALQAINPGIHNPLT